MTSRYLGKGRIEIIYFDRKIDLEPVKGYTFTVKTKAPSVSDGINRSVAAQAARYFRSPERQ
jgi:hypothetical protein